MKKPSKKIPLTHAEKLAQKREYRKLRKADGKPIKSGPSGKPLCKCGVSWRFHPTPTCPKYTYPISKINTVGIERVKNTQFIAWDSEGYTDEKGVHKLCFFANSSGDEIDNSKNPLTYEHIIPWLYEYGSKRSRLYINVFYSASYDWSMILLGLNREKLQRIHHNKTEQILGKENCSQSLWKSLRGTLVDCADGNCYEILLMKRKFLKIRKLEKRVVVVDPETKKEKYKLIFSKKTAVFHDVFPFFQMSFVKALEKNVPNTNDLSLIKEGKSKRAINDSLTDEMKTYCRAELKALVSLCNNLRDNLVHADIPISRWYGPGSIASTFLRKYDIKKHQNSVDNYPTKDFETILASAFAGARIEMLQYGHAHKTVHDYDVNSCYPYFLARLPSFAPENGEWIHHDNVPLSKLDTIASTSVFKIVYRGKYENAFHPFFYRARNHCIYFPLKTMGWYYHAEVKAAYDARKTLPYEILEILECWEWKPHPEIESPFCTMIVEGFAQRKALKKEFGKYGPEKVVKLALNSLYGKMAQRVGYSYGKANELKRPPFHDLFAAGYITANARAALYRLGAKNPSAVISFATDGLTASEKLEADVGEKIGQWEYSQYDDGLFLQAGMYCLINADGSYKLTTRGFARPDNLDDFIATIDAAWKEKKSAVEIPCRIFYQLGAALAVDRDDETVPRLGQWGEIPDRKLQINCLGIKRMSSRSKAERADLHLITTAPSFDLAAFIRADGIPQYEYQHDYFPVSYPSPIEWIDETRDDYMDIFFGVEDANDILGK